MTPTDRRAIGVLAGEDRFREQRKVFGVMAFTIKIASRDTGGQLLIIEQANAYRGGPPRHLHHEQDEWFYAVEGEYTVEVGEQTYLLRPGDSVFAPRGVPHVWALTGAGAGRMLIAFQPAGSMEAFFDEATKLAGTAPRPELERLFAAHGMRIEGPPMQVP